MNRAIVGALVLAAGVAAGATGYAAGQRALWPKVTQWAATRWSRAATLSAPASGPVIYYSDPDGRPVYSAIPRQTLDGRAFRKVLASQDVRFDGKPAAAAPVLSSVQKSASNPQKILFYRNPMGLPDTSKTPKKDSMGMDYIPVYAGAPKDASIISLSPGRIQRSGVKSQTVRMRQLVTKLHVPGVVQLDERRVSVVAMRADAFIDTVANVTTGDFVHKGEPLLQLYSPDMAAASAQYLSALNSPGLDSRGALRRLQNLAFPETAIAQIRLTHKVPANITWTAPQDGVVITRNISAGMKAAAGDVLFRLADISTVWVIADVPEYELGSVKLGAPAHVAMRGLPGRSFNGHVSLIYPQISTSTRSAKVRIELANPDGVLLPDMYGDVDIADAEPAPVVAVPDDAVIDSGQRQMVILDLGKGRFEPRRVEIGKRGSGFTQIRKGVNPGDRVVVAANFLIDSESNLQAALRGMDASGPTGGEPKP